MRISGDDPHAMYTLSEWLSARGWGVRDTGDGERDVLIPWDQDEFTAALFLRSEIDAWGSTSDESGEISLDADLWRRLAARPPSALARR